MRRTASRYASDLYDELVVDNFAGGGGASLGIEQAIGRAIDLAINHDRDAIEMHRANHPATRHLCEDVWQVDPREVTGGRPVGLAWFSPDCKHFSKAKGGKPVSKRVRGLAWVVVRWARAVRPRVIILENVEEFTTWGPLTSDGRPCPQRRGRTFRLWVSQLRRLGYAVEWRELRACDYGAPTIRKRLFLIARCDGMPIVWPEPTHAAPAKAAGLGLKPWRAAAECIDWALPCPSIFERRRPLAENTLRRIANGIRRYVIETAEPFIVCCNHGGPEFRGQDPNRPFRTVTASRDAHGLVVPTVARIGQTGGGGKYANDVRDPLTTITSKAEHVLVAPYFVPRHRERDGQAPRCRSVEQPLPTVTPTANGASLVAAFLAKHYGGNETPGWPLDKPLSTATAKDHHAIAAAHLVKLRGTCRDGQLATDPMPTVTAGGNHIAEVRAFLLKYYGTKRDGCSLHDPAHTLTAKHRLGLVTVAGEDWQIVDIGMRMLTPRELARAQGFPDEYELTGSKANQVAKIGNSVCPVMARVLVAANCASVRRRAHA